MGNTMVIKPDTPMNEPSHAGLHNTIDEKITQYDQFAASHTHEGLAKDPHEHANLADKSHGHTDLAGKSHEHTGLADKSHGHTDLAGKSHSHPEYSSSVTQIEENRVATVNLQNQVNDVEDSLEDVKVQLGAILVDFTDTATYKFLGLNQYVSGMGGFSANMESGKVVNFLLDTTDVYGTSVDLQSLTPGDVLSFEVPKNGQDPVVRTWIVERTEPEGELYRLYVSNRDTCPFVGNENYTLTILRKQAKSMDVELAELREQVAYLTEAVEGLLNA